MNVVVPQQQLLYHVYIICTVHDCAFRGEGEHNANSIIMYMCIHVCVHVCMYVYVGARIAHAGGYA